MFNYQIFNSETNVPSRFYFLPNFFTCLIIKKIKNHITRMWYICANKLHITCIKIE